MAGKHFPTRHADQFVMILVEIQAHEHRCRPRSLRQGDDHIRNAVRSGNDQRACQRRCIPVLSLRPDPDGIALDSVTEAAGDALHRPRAVACRYGDRPGVPAARFIPGPGQGIGRSGKRGGRRRRFGTDKQRSGYIFADVFAAGIMGCLNRHGHSRLVGIGCGQVRSVYGYDGLVGCK